MVEGLVQEGVSTVSQGMAKMLVGFLALIGALMVIFGMLNAKGLWVLFGGLIMIMSLFILVIMYVMGFFDRVQQGVETVRRAKNVVDEVAPNAIPTVARGVQRGLDAVSGRRPLLQPWQGYDQGQYQKQPYPEPQYQQAPQHQQPPQYQQVPQYQQQPPPPPEPPSPQAIGPLYHPCPTCGAGNAPGDAYCHYCKRPLRR